jgi:oligopeptidase B
MEAGHGGKSGRFQQYRSRAEYYAFMLQQLGVASQAPAPAIPPSPERGR